MTHFSSQSTYPKSYPVRVKRGNSTISKKLSPICLGDWSVWFRGIVASFIRQLFDDQWTHFKDLLFGAADRSIPKVVLGRCKRSSWLSEETLHLVHKKRNYKLAKCTGRTKTSWYRTISNRVRDLTRRNHREHLEDITKNLHNDQKTFWRWLKRTKQVATGIQNLIFRARAIEKARVFNQYFSSTFTKEDLSNVDRLQEELPASKNPTTLEDIHISAEAVLKELKSIDVTKASGPDNIPGRLLWEGAICLAKPLSNFFNVSLQTGSLPSDWKRANITPVFKKGSQHTPSNYCPVSLTSTVIKILERIVHRITRFLNKTNELHDYQHGFRTAHSCQIQLLTVVHEWARSLNSAKPSHVIFLDFSKAFDSVPHCWLLLKLQSLECCCPG